MPHRVLITRIRAEFREMPGLRLTLPQAQRLCGGDRRSCELALAALVDEQFLQLRHGHYSRPSEADHRDSVNGEVQNHRHQHVHGAA